MQIHSKHCGYSRDGIRLYHKVGGDPGAQARQQEAERQARVAAATEKINSIFNNSGRDVLYADQKQAVYDLNKRDVERQAQVAGRNNKFALARAGQLGGSLDVDSNAEIGRVTNEGLLQAGGIADASAAELKANDERTRANLISMAQSGIDTGSAATMALQGLDANAKTSAAQRAGASVGNLFADLGQAYYQNQINQGTRAGMNGFGQFTGVSAPSSRYVGSTSK